MIILMLESRHFKAWEPSIDTRYGCSETIMSRPMSSYDDTKFRKILFFTSISFFQTKEGRTLMAGIYQTLFYGGSGFYFAAFPNSPYIFTIPFIIVRDMSVLYFLTFHPDKIPDILKPRLKISPGPVRRPLLYRPADNSVHNTGQFQWDTSGC